MNEIKQADKRKLRLVFYLFCMGIFLNIQWLLTGIIGKVLDSFGINYDVEIRDFTVKYSYPIIISVLLFTLGYYIFMKKKIYGFELILILSGIFLIIIPFFLLTNAASSGIQHR